MSFYMYNVQAVRSYRLRLLEDHWRVGEDDKITYLDHVFVEEKDRYVEFVPHYEECGPQQNPYYSCTIRIVIKKEVRFCLNGESKLDLKHYDPTQEMVLDGYTFPPGTWQLKEEEVKFEQEFHKDQLESKLGHPLFPIFVGICVEEVKGEALAHSLRQIIGKLLFDKQKLMQEWFPKTYANNQIWKRVRNMFVGMVFKTKKEFVIIDSTGCLPISAIDSKGNQISISVADLECDAKGNPVEYDPSNVEDTIQLMLTSDERNERNRGRHVQEAITALKKKRERRKKDLERRLEKAKTPLKEG